MCGVGSSEFAVDAMDNLCVNRLDVVIQSFNELMQTGMSPGPLTDTTVKVSVCVCANGQGSRVLLIQAVLAVAHTSTRLTV